MYNVYAYTKSLCIQGTSCSIICIGHDSDERSRSRYNLPTKSRSRSRDSFAEPEPQPSEMWTAPHLAISEYSIIADYSQSAISEMLLILFDRTCLRKDHLHKNLLGNKVIKMAGLTRALEGGLRITPSGGGGAYNAPPHRSQLL